MVKKVHHLLGLSGLANGLSKSLLMNLVVNCSPTQFNLCKMFEVLFRIYTGPS